MTLRNIAAFVAALMAGPLFVTLFGWLGAQLFPSENAGAFVVMGALWLGHS